MTPPIIPNFDPSDEDLAESLSQGFHLLQTERRRYVIWCMAYLAPEDTITVREIAKSIAAMEQDVPEEAVVNQDYRPVYTNLTQHHLPELDEADVVEFDSDRKEISPGRNAPAFAVMASVTVPIAHFLLDRRQKE
ncbi:DUF7344 domain-containing protein [Halosimplex halophilum]